MKLAALFFVAMLACDPECLSPGDHDPDGDRCDAAFAALAVIDRELDAHGLPSISGIVGPRIVIVDAESFSFDHMDRDGKPLWGHTDLVIDEGGVLCQIFVATRLPGYDQAWPVSFHLTSLAHEALHCSLGLAFATFQNFDNPPGDPAHNDPMWPVFVPAANAALEAAGL